MTDFQIISHACSKIEYSNKKLITDPWIIGSCYWRSWWNFPEVKRELLDDNLNADYIYITHVHWDHWHGPTLKKFSRETTVIFWITIPEQVCLKVVYTIFKAHKVWICI